MSRLALHVEGNAIGSLGLDLQASCKQRKKPGQLNCRPHGKLHSDEEYLFTRANVVEVLVEKLLKPIVSAFAARFSGSLCLLAVMVVYLVVVLVPRKITQG